MAFNEKFDCGHPQHPGELVYFGKIRERGLSVVKFMQQTEHIEIFKKI